MAALANGTVLRNRYQIIQLIGRGGFGETYLAEDIKIDLTPKPKRVVKRLLPQMMQPVVVELFKKEAATIDRLGEYNSQIARLFDNFQENQEYYLVQSYIEGHALSQEIIQGQKLSESYVIQFLSDFLPILAYVHQNQVIHRDIKPENIMRRQHDGKLVLIDFGIVKEMGSVVITQGQTRYTVSAGTPGYMPAEQANGKPRYSSDVYAVGVMAISALTGISPEKLQQDNDGEIIWRKYASVSDGLADILTKMVRYDWRLRYEDGGKALAAIQSLTSAPPPGAWEEEQKRLEALKQQQQEAAMLLAVSRQREAELKRKEEELRRREEELKRQEEQKRLEELRRREEELRRLEEEKRREEQKRLEELRRREEEGKRLLVTPPPRLPVFTFDVITVDKRGKQTSKVPKQAQYYHQDLGNGIFLDMVAIPGGKFQMGTPNSEPERSDAESPQHQVTVPSFYMAKYPITQAQYQAIMGQNPSHFKGSDLPVENVSWNNAIEFCQKLAQKTGQAYRLPSEAEWEYACRAGTTTPFHFGDTITTDLANYDGNQTYGNGPKGEYRQKTTPVGTFPPNAFGLYDMHGNVWEWCQDVWHENYDNAPTDGSAWETGGESNLRVLRGGSWVNFPRNCRSGRRYWDVLVDWLNYFGFRVAVSLLPVSGSLFSSPGL
ncbi:MAG TPA: SUMF1/EgtB/PvdO family nonheme iron enzyme [Oscillatoriaceae cyanobacterium M33_DOE_052]|uniref:Protein kinase n=1 Tax=Planktothricoides sp. SpSt-374 TaxID=2282167 RepID=A0A7C3VKE6_9CYAN|nr:SUMF1/EgtB/PvdO family nonheme iron enzyme [Oscillatoriaceae cyanobacterium M33_DOE_052]